jgi:ATP-dependent Clp protease, protease subunit
MSEEIENILIPKVRFENLSIKDMTFDKKEDAIIRENGVLFMDKKFTNENCAPLIKSIICYNLMPKNKQPLFITLYINSYGGNLNSCFNLIDIMKKSRIPVHTFGLGTICSAGASLFMAGEKGHRYLSENCEVMTHQYWCGNRGKEHELEAANKRFKIMKEKKLKHYIKCTGKSVAYVKKNLLPASDVWMTPKQAVRHGIADKIIDIY